VECGLATRGDSNTLNPLKNRELRRKAAPSGQEPEDVSLCRRVRSEMVDQITLSSNTPGSSNTLIFWLREVAAMRQAA
jgi:hypothetical protein